MHNLDLPSTTIQRRQTLKNKKYLNKVYEGFYKIFKKYSEGLPIGKKVELGSGGGFIKDLIPEAVTSDIIKLPFTDLKFSAEKMPFPDSSVSVFYMLNTFHHIKNPEEALKEMNRCLKKNGKIIMIEPSNTFLSRFVYKTLGHEDFDTYAGWESVKKGPLSDSNQALTYIVFVRDRLKFQNLFPKLKLVKYENHTPFSFIISGGFKYRSVLPAFFYSFITSVEKKLYFTNNFIGLFTTIIIKKM